MQIVVVFIALLFIDRAIYKLSLDKIFNENQFIVGKIAFSSSFWECYPCPVFLFVLLGTFISKKVIP